MLNTNTNTNAFHRSWVAYLCTCARAHHASASQERLGRYYSNLVCGLGTINYVLSQKFWVGCICTCARRIPFLYLGNRWAPCAEIWWVVRNPVAMRFMQDIGWVPLHVRTCTPHLRISGTDWPIVLKFDVCEETQLLRGLQKSEVGLLHIRTFVFSFVVSETIKPCPWN